MFGYLPHVVKTAVAVVLATSGVTTAAVASQKAPASKGTLVALGDSITFGYNLADTAGNSVASKSAYPALMAKAEGFRVSDLGVPGWTSTDLLAALDTPSFSRAVRGASVLTLDIGSNDLLQWADKAGLLADATSQSAPTLSTNQQIQAAAVLAQFGVNFDKIVARIRSLTSAPIVAFNLYDPFPSSSPLSNIDELMEEVENEEISEIAGQYKNIAVADAHTAFAGKQTADVRIAEDDVHPTPSGQQALARVGEQAIAPLLAKRQKPGSASGVTGLLAGSVDKAGGRLTGHVNGSAVTLQVPANAVQADTEVALTSQQLSASSAAAALGATLPKGNFAVEMAVNLGAAQKFAKKYTLTIQNSAIEKGAKVYTLSGTKLTAVSGASVKKGQASVQASSATDFVVLNPPTSTKKG
ncbi:SGNH/GDSL hydrolase family protein [Alicyclobacillus acidoterrestris]|uniref:GDSL-type esterase/lipase family protein n=1 Tax=Alicyclobacillus acidoterrestris (strain ATCC 49025 / DSM 3922 / CIP 106132 / NCIMB 13137 / GD3B) TaxID=1356854 RepID=T0D5X7_ALIAG|nr:GDSL-type esterase/lipase family protein [Alicyclobacillus acidoterrestris]EPZ45136.1 hypothetical protein N007_10015 [Alicyclobacillus acidoterrestris ATCC 49025]UNO48418.1 GDSL-type esterase/lipase family protein [Alicyclobacillus acidoterrestris]